nr:hypothetical protein [Salinispora cortesiana]
MQTAFREGADLIRALCELLQVVAAVGVEGPTFFVWHGADIHDVNGGVQPQFVVDAGGDADAAEVGIRANDDPGGLLRRLDDHRHDGIGRLPVAPDDRQIGPGVTDRFGRLPVLHDQQDITRPGDGQSWQHVGA